MTGTLISLRHLSAGSIAGMGEFTVARLISTLRAGHGGLIYQDHGRKCRRFIGTRYALTRGCRRPERREPIHLGNREHEFHGLHLHARVIRESTLRCWLSLMVAASLEPSWRATALPFKNNLFS